MNGKTPPGVIQKDNPVSDTPDLSQEQPDDDDLVKQLRAQIRERDQRLSEAESRAGSLEKKDVFRDLNIATDAGPGKLLFEHYSGELSPEAVKAAAEEYGITPATPTGEGGGQEPATPTGQEPPAPTGQQPPQPHPDAAQHAALQQARSGSTQTGALPDDRERAQARYTEMINGGRTNDDAMAGYFSERFNAALEGQQRGT